MVLDSLNLELSSKEKKVRKIWVILLFVNLALAYYYFTLFPAGEQLPASATKLSKALSQQNVPVLKSIVGMFFLLLFRCSYKQHNFSLLRVKVFISALSALAFFIQLVIVAAVFFVYFSNKRVDVIEGQPYQLIWYIPFVFLLMMGLSLYHTFLSYRLIRINKKKKSKEFLAPNQIEELLKLKKLPDGPERKTLYNKLLGHLPEIPWLVKRAWKRKENLISNW